MTWHELYQQAIQDYNDTPGPTLEQHLIDAYAQHPAAVQVAIGKITQAYKAGRINSPWGAIKTEVDKQISVRKHIPQATDRGLAERNTEQWIRAAGLHYDRYSELHDELFGDRGPLRVYTDDQVLETRIRKLYDEARPVGEQLEADELERANLWKLASPSSPFYKPPPKDYPSEPLEAA